MITQFSRILLCVEITEPVDTYFSKLYNLHEPKTRFNSFKATISHTITVRRRNKVEPETILKF